jgi:ribonuclease E
MPNKMLIDATHPEETRVVVLRGQRVEEFDFESANRKQLRGNIYLAKVTRVEPSLQAAFIDYGGNRHGFLAFSEIHPDYYQIPIADRQALIAEDERAQRAAEAEADHRVGQRTRASARAREKIKSPSINSTPETESEAEAHAMAAGSEQIVPPAHAVETPEVADSPVPIEHEIASTEHVEDVVSSVSGLPIELDQLQSSSAAEQVPVGGVGSAVDVNPAEATSEIIAPVVPTNGDGSETPLAANITEVNGVDSDEEVVESVGGADALEEVPERMPRLRRQYKIQEVIKRRQIMLVQVVKEERGTKGAALTTYLSLAGRYSVLMPNTARGGGISRKITSMDDRRRLKEIAQDLEVPEGMGVILRTAGASRTKIEVKRDFEYLLRLWETVRDLTLKSTAPKLVYEEGSLVKRSLRDLYSKDIDEILVAGQDAYQEAKDFMRMLMPSHAKNVKLYGDSLPIFTRHGIESQLDAMFTPVMQLRSGGYIVLNQAEALVAIDVNSGRATREHHIEDTALKTNMEAAEEIARQLRLRDLAGLIVIDFIDMDEKRNNRAVERRLKECLRHDRARIQVGHISHFGLLEMSRQRIRSSVLESSTERCANCGGSGHVRSVSSVALQLLRSLEEMLLKGATHNLIVRTRSEIALYLLNYKRAHLRSLEERFRIAIIVNADPSVAGQPSFVLDKGEQVHSLEQAKALAAQAPGVTSTEAAGDEEEEFEIGEGDEDELEEAAGAIDFEAEGRDEESDQLARVPGQEAVSDGAGRRRRRRRRSRRGGEMREESLPRQEAASAGSEPRSEPPTTVEQTASGEQEEQDETDKLDDAQVANLDGDSERRRRRRGRRGGRRNRSQRESEGLPAPVSAAEPQPEAIGDLNIQHSAMVAPSSTPEREQPPHMAAASHAAADETSAPAASPVVESTPAEAVRRRSTVREPATASLRHDIHEPAISVPVQAPPEAVESSSETTESNDRPRRSGWWSKRLKGH